MTTAHLTVWFENRSYRFFPGATVADLIGRLPEGVRQAIREGRALLTDRDGYEVGMEGALSPEAVYMLVRPVRGSD